MRRIRLRLTYANVISTLCLVLLVGGGSAYAAAELGKESVGRKQLAKEAVTPAKLSKASKSVLTGPAGPKGATGATGPQGLKGDQGEKGDPGPAVQILPSGQTESGVWAVFAAAGGYGMASLNFSPHLAGSVEFSHEIEVPEEEIRLHCPGFGKADPGYLCMYTAFEHEVTFQGFLGAFGSGVDEPGEPEGTVAYFKSSGGAGTASDARGNWAYTAP
jgi:hypothetical protein